MSETDLAPPASEHKRLLKLARKRLERFVTLLPKVLVKNDPDTIHDLRVWSRRLQQALRVGLTNPKPPKLKKTIRILRRVRQAFGPCRNLDVNLALITERRRRAGTAIVRRSWDALQHDLEGKREALLESACREIAEIDFFAFIDRARTLLGSAKRAEGRSANVMDELAEAAVEAMKACDEACAQAYDARDEYHLHQFRIAAKRVRYRIELLADLGQAKAKPLLNDLKELQTALGDWHDGYVLLQSIAEFIGRQNFLAEHPDLSKALLAEMEKDQLCQQTNIDQLFEKAAKMQKSWTEWRSSLTETATAAGAQ